MRFIFVLITFLASFAMATHVAVLETIGEGKVLGRAERMYLTDRLREVAVKTLPAYMGFTIMTRENINEMLPPGKSLEECEGSCLVETGKNISADFIAQARVNKFGSKLTISVELYETAGNKLISSFTGRSSDADGLLEEVEKKAVSLFSAIKAQNVTAGGNEGFSGFQEGESFNMKVNHQYVVRVNSKPEGAMLSVDGRPKCKSTPCNVQLESGIHNFSFAFDMYFDKDTSIDVQSNEQRISVSLLPNFGVLNLNPQLGAYGKASELDIRVDGETQKVGSMRLFAGKHHVEIKHRCYEPMSFDVSVKNGSELTFDRTMQPAVGGLSLTAEGKKGPESLPVFVDGKLVGKTPYQESVLICAKVGVGDARDSVPVKLKYHETVEFVYRGSFGGSLKDRDGNVYRTVKIGKQVWMAENLNVKTKDSRCYEDNELNCKKYGRLYDQWDAVKACPAGWHLPRKAEFETLFKEVGGQSVAGKLLKSVSAWNNSGNGTDAFAFSALPAGYRDYDGNNFYSEGKNAYFWSTTTSSGDYAYRMYLNHNDGNAYLHYDNTSYGYSVRCVKDPD